MAKVKCEKCGASHDYVTQMDSVMWQESHRCFNLSLLIVDFGECCAIKVETCSEKGVQLFIGGNTVDLTRDDVRMCHFPFDELRRDIDACEGEKPVPRLEHIGEWYDLWHGSTSAPWVLPKRSYEALCTLAGVTIPIYEPQQGEWKRLYPFEDDVAGAPSQARAVNHLNTRLPLSVWQYTRRGK